MAPPALARPVTDPADLLRRAKRIAIVGCSATPGKPAHDVPKFALEHGYDIVPVNPAATEIFGLKVYRTLAEVPGTLDVVDVFRPAEEAPDIARQAVAVGANALWLQTGIVSEEARRIARDAGLDYLEDACLRTEIRRMQRSG